MWEIKGANIKNLDRYFGGLGQAPNRTRTFCSTWDFCWRWNPPLLTIYQKSLASAEWHFPMAIFPFVGRGRLSEGCQHVSPWGWTAYFGNKCWVNIHRNLNLITWLLMILDKQVFFFFFRIRLGKLDNFWMILPEGPVRTSGQSFQGHAWQSNTRYFLYEVCFLVGVSGREGLGVTSVQVGDVWRLLKDWQWEGLPTATAKSFRGIWLQSMDCQWLSHMVFQTPAQVIVMR